MALMAMPTSAPVIAIVNIFGIAIETTLTTNPIVDSTTATSQTHQLFVVNRPNATTNDAIHRISIPRGTNNTSKSVKIGPLACAIAVSSVVIPASKLKAPAITKRSANIVRPVGLCLVRSLLLLVLLLLLVICVLPDTIVISSSISAKEIGELIYNELWLLLCNKM